MIVCVSEHGAQYQMEAIAENQRLWCERIDKTALRQWLSQACASGRLKRQQTLMVVVPETWLVRRFLKLPQAANQRQLRSMAAHALLPVLGERPSWLAVTPLSEGAALCGCKQETVAELLMAFGSQRRQVRLIGAADYAAAQQTALADGYYSLQDPLCTTVAAVRDGRIVDARAEYGGQPFGLLQTLLAAHRGLLSLAENVQPLPQSADAVPQEAALLAAALSRSAQIALPNVAADRVLAALLIGCVVVPGALLLGSMLRPAEVTEESGTEAVETVARSDYHTLLTQAYAVKSDRIILLNQEAGDDALALSGRCSEPLDLADYMRQLAASEPALHPLLLEMTRKSTDDVYYYDFVVQISLQGREGT